MLPQKIEAVYVWICTELDGQEGIPAAFLPGFDGPSPLIGADRERIESLRPLAENVAKDLGLPVKLVKFDRMTVIEELPRAAHGTEQ